MGDLFTCYCDGVPSKLPVGRLFSISAGDLHACDVRMDGTVVCWGWDEFGDATPPGLLPM